MFFHLPVGKTEGVDATAGVVSRIGFFVEVGHLLAQVFRGLDVSVRELDGRRAACRVHLRNGSQNK